MESRGLTLDKAHGMEKKNREKQEREKHEIIASKRSIYCCY